MDLAGLAAIGAPAVVAAFAPWALRDRSNVRMAERVLALDRRKVRDARVREQLSLLQLDVLDDALLDRKFPTSSGQIYVGIAVSYAAYAASVIAEVVKAPAYLQINLIVVQYTGIVLEVMGAIFLFMQVRRREKHIANRQSPGAFRANS